MTRREDGVAVVMTLGLLALLFTVALVGGGAVAIVTTHRQVEAAADLAALAGAAAAQSAEEPCAAVERIGRRNGVVVARCDVFDSVVAVVVERKLPGPLGGRMVRARARAGPG